jgi:integrase
MNKKRLAPGVFRLSDGRVYVLARLAAGNLKKEKTLPKGTSVSDAVLVRESFLRDFRKQTSADIGSLTTFGEVLELYDKNRTWGDGVYKRLKKELVNAPISAIYAQMAKFVDKLKRSKSSIDKAFSPATINRHVAMAKAAVAYAYKRRKIEENFMTCFPMQTEDNRRYRILDEDERKKLFKELPEYLRPIFYFACRVPARVGELVNLTRAHYNRFQELIILEDGETKNGEGRWLPVFDEMKDYFHNLPTGTDYLFYREEEGKYLPLGYYSPREGRIVPGFKKA